MKFLWLGSYASDEMLSEMPIRSIGQASGITSQKSLIYGIDQCDKFGISMDTINAQGFPCYPVYPQKRISRFEWSRNNKNTDISISFNNRKLFRTSSQYKGYKQEVKKWLNKVDKDERVYLIIYEPVLQRLAVAKWIKKVHPNTIVSLVIPDIPEFVGNTSNRIIRALKQVRKKLLNYYMAVVDKYILYAEPMASYYGLKKSQYIVMEGSFDPRELLFFDAKEENETDDIIMMYSGAVTKGRAINRFVEAFRKIDDENLKLWVTGGGDYEQQLQKNATEDPRIHYYGYMDLRSQVLTLQSKATVLLHIRDKDAISSKYCFPSKIFEYMASGKIVITVRIDGIPKDYYNYMLV
ncbi:MAG: glycosyltransferase, partial [Ruminococcaceae bacterium]|nr:glycosyltransferase [Oscillospiraceae bacterium]